jgi:hypothetical protein
MLSNLGTGGMAAEDGPWLRNRSIPLESMLHPRYWRSRKLHALVSGETTSLETNVESNNTDDD